MEIYNGTPHELVLIDPYDRSTILDRIPSHGVIRAPGKSLRLRTILAGGIPFPLIERTNGKPTGLPDRQIGRIIVVSAIAYQAIKEYYPERTGPDGDVRMTTDPVRNEAGQVIGVCGLAY